MSSRYLENTAVPPPMIDRIFSFRGVCTMVIVLLIFGFATRRLVEPDFWWHLRDGRQIVQQHSIPRTITYTLGAAGTPYVDFEWLAETIYYLGYRTAGLRGVVATYFGVLVLLYAGLYYLACGTGADNSSALLVTLLAVLLGSVGIGPRAHLFGWLCMVCLLLLLDRFRRTGRGIWLVPPLFALWINLHGSWLFGIIVLAVTIASGLVEGRWGIIVARRWTAAELKRLLLVFGCSVAALFVNPFGYKLPLYPFDLLFRQSIAMQYVEEWQSVDFGKGSGKLALITVLVLLLTALLSRRRWRLDETLLMVFALWVGLSHVRMLIFFGLIVTPIIAPRLDLMPPSGHERNRPFVNAAIMAVMAAWVVLSFPTEVKLQHQLDEKFPTAALNFVRAQHITGAVLSEDWWGGYVGWKTPEFKPFIDSRADVFVYDGSFDDYLSAVKLRHPFDVLDKRKIDYALLEANEPLVSVLEQSPAWRVIYSDPMVVLLARSQLSTQQ